MKTRIHRITSRHIAVFVSLTLSLNAFAEKTSPPSTVYRWALAFLAGETLAREYSANIKVGKKDERTDALGKMALLLAQRDELPLGQLEKLKKTIALGSATFASLLPLVASTSEGTLWSKLLQPLDPKNASPCPTDQVVLKRIVDAQIKFIENGMLDYEPTLKELQQLSVPQTECLFVSLFKQDEEKMLTSGYEPLFALQALTELQTPAPRQGSIRLFYILRLMQADHYPEVLRELLSVVAAQNEFRALYNSSQRIYQMTRTGKGEVALKQDL